MHRIDGDGNVSGEFTQTPTPGNNSTQVTADWLNAVQNEIVNFLETNGVTLDKADNTQFSALMVTLFTAAKKVAGDYEIETVTIPGGTDKKIKITNKQTGKYFTITETRSPDGTTVEATHALGAVADGIDWIFDFSMHNYDAGIMKGVHVLQCFNADTKGAMYWVIRHRPTGETGYGTMEDYYMMKLDETNGLQVNAAASEGVAPTWVKVRTASDDYLFATAAQGARADGLADMYSVASNPGSADAVLSTSGIETKHFVVSKTCLVELATGSGGGSISPRYRYNLATNTPLLARSNAGQSYCVLLPGHYEMVSAVSGLNYLIIIGVTGSTSSAGIIAEEA